MKFNQSVIEALIDEVESVQGNYGASFEEDGPPTASIDAKVRGTWLWVSGRSNYEGATWDPSTDRASGDPYSAHVVRDWVGKKDTAPASVSSYEELHEWALFHTRYEREYTDVGVWGVHKDRYVTDVTKEGIVKLNVVSNRRFQDVSPSSETVDDTLDLSAFKSVTFKKLVKSLKDSNSLVREVAAKQLGILQDTRAIDPHLLETVDDESEYVRDYAVIALGSLGGPKAIKKLSDLLLQSQYPPKSVILALSKIGKPGIDAVSPGLASDLQAVRLAVISVLQNIGGDKSIKLLRQSIKDNLTDEKVTTLQRLIGALGELGATDAIEDIIPFLDHDDSSVQTVTVNALEKMKSEKVILPLVQGLLTSHHWTRKKIVESLNELGWKPSNPEEESWILFADEDWEKLIELGEPATEIILRALTDKDEYHRGKILEPLRDAGIMFSDQRIADAIISIYKDKEQPSYRKRYALEALVCVPSPKVVSFFIREYPNVKDSFVQDKLFDVIKNVVTLGIDVSKKLVSHLKKKKLDDLSKKQIKSYLELFKIIPLTLEQLETVRPLIISLDKKKLSKESKEIISELTSLESIIPAFSDDRLSVRKRTMKAMKEISIPSAIYPLSDALRDEHYYIREQVPKMIDKLGDGAVSKTIIALTDKDHRVRMGAAEALGRLRSVKAAEPLLIALQDEHRIVRQNSAWAIGRLYLHYSHNTELKTRIIETLVHTMKSDEYLPVRYNATYSLGQLDDARVVIPLLDALKHQEKEIRLNATYGFIKLSQELDPSSKDWKKITGRLIETLSDENSRVRYNAVDGLRFYGGDEALAALKKYEDDDDPEMRELVQEAIEEINQMKGRRRSSWGFYSRTSEQLRDPSVIEELLPFFMDESDEVQRSTQIAIGKFGNIAFDRMMEILLDKEQHYMMRMGAAAAFADIGDKRATDILIETLNDEQPRIRIGKYV
ncbi:MAG: HEAT repeat domain-containing protein [Candidatus Thorarchaeota archaeon]|jgi:HEAT repeat protein